MGLLALCRGERVEMLRNAGAVDALLRSPRRMMASSASSSASSGKQKYQPDSRKAAANDDADDDDDDEAEVRVSVRIRVDRQQVIETVFLSSSTPIYLPF